MATASDTPAASTRHVPDLRYGIAPTIDKAPGVDPAGDARALLAPGTQSPATAPIPGTLILYREDSGRRYVLRIPDEWNGSLVVAGTPGTRSEFASDGTWNDFALARGYAFASSNKGIPYNMLAEPLADAASPAYPIPFDAGSLETQRMAFRFGVLSPRPVGIASWNQDFRRLIDFARITLALQRGTVPVRTYAVGTSNGGAQVRTALEHFSDVLDGGVEYAGVRWTSKVNLLTLLPPFLAAMPAYVRSNFSDVFARRAIEGAGFPADIVQNSAAHPSLWCEYYSNVAPFYADVSVFIYALLVDPRAAATLGLGAGVPNAENPHRLPGSMSAGGLAQPELRAAYELSPQGRDAIIDFEHTGRLRRPLISLAGTKDVLIPPAFHAVGYAQAVAAAGSSRMHRLYLIERGTHLDSFVAYGYGLRPQLPFAWAAFDQLVRTVEHDDTRGVGTTRSVTSPSEIT